MPLVFTHVLIQTYFPHPQGLSLLALRASVGCGLLQLGVIAHTLLDHAPNWVRMDPSGIVKGSFKG